jgi:hypothetical protein
MFHCRILIGSHSPPSGRFLRSFSLVLPLGIRRRGGGGGGEDGRLLDGVARRATLVGGLGGYLDPAVTRPYGGSRAEKRRQQGGETKDWLGHRCKHGEDHRCTRVRVHP